MIKVWWQAMEVQYIMPLHLRRRLRRTWNGGMADQLWWEGAYEKHGRSGIGVKAYPRTEEGYPYSHWSRNIGAMELAHMERENNN